MHGYWMFAYGFQGRNFDLQGRKLCWTFHFRIVPGPDDVINWKACGNASRLLGVGLHFWKTKHIAGIFANGKWMHRWKFWSHSKCPRCKQTNEDAAHTIIQCPDVNPLWQTAVEPLTKWMANSLTPPDVSAVILEFLHAWRTSLPSCLRMDRCTTDLWGAIASQLIVGWGAFLEGYLVSPDWEILMDRHYESITSRQSGLRYCSGIIHRLWLLIRDLWEHRNAVLHDDIPAAVQQATVQLNASVSGQYHQGLNGLSPPNFRSYFSRSLVDLLNMTVSYKRNWLANLLAGRDFLHNSMSSEHDTRAQE
eukprot:scaffold1128_cov41-Attheya_sp.AAC.5